MIIVVDAGSETAPDIAKSLTSLAMDVTTVDLCDMTATAANNSKGVVVSGSPKLFANPEETLIDHIDWIADITVPYLGICFGHQALGIVHGASIYTGQRVRGMTPIQLTDRHALVHKVDDGTPFFESHTEGINLPQGFTLLGASEAYSNEIMAHKSHPWYSVQFHPESSSQQGLQLFRNFITMIH